MTLPGRRLLRERQTIEAMVAIYCHDHHPTEPGNSPLCEDCAKLLNYAERRLSICPFQEDKPACVHCQVHCYSKSKREQVKQIMRYAGPRMLLRHPWLSLMHLLDKRRRAPTPGPRGQIR